MAFTHGYEYLKACIDEKRFGKVWSAFFNRVSAQPLWGFENWCFDYNRCGAIGAANTIRLTGPILPR